MTLCWDGVQSHLLLLIGLLRTKLSLPAAVTESPALDARDGIEHRATHNDADTHHVERVVVAVGDVI